MKKASLIIREIEAGRHDGAFAGLYGSADGQRERYIGVLRSLISRYGDRETAVFSAPGRVEIGGNHTDHNRGRVLAAAVTLDIIGAASPRAGSAVRLKSAGFAEDVADAGDPSPAPGGFGKSSSLISGVAAGFLKNGGRTGGFDCCTQNDVAKGSGLSSSAAFEMLNAAVFNTFFNGGRFSPVQLASIGQYAENVFFGKPSGLMDQTASAVGGFVGIDFADPGAPVVTPVDFDFASSGYSLLVTDTGGSHASLTEEYAAIRREMAETAGYFSKQALREVGEEEFFASVPQLRKKFGDRAVLRSIHFFAEDRRAAQELEALRAGDLRRFLALVGESGRSSFMYNQNAYAAGSPRDRKSVV